MKKLALYVSILVITPLVTMAATVDLFSILTTLNVLLTKWIVPILITLGVIYFIWGVLQFILGSAEEAKKEGRAKILNGLIGLFVIIAFWGIIALVTSTFGPGPTQITEDQIPCIPGPGVICPQD
jgi:hypothetical protein